MNNDCEFAGSKDCLCSACQSMKKTLEEMSKNCFEKLTDGTAGSSESKKEN